MAISTINSSGLNQAGDTVFCTTSGNVGIGTSSPNIGGANTDNAILTLKGKASTRGGIFEMGNFGTTGNDQTLGWNRYFDGSTENASIEVARASSTSTAYIKFSTNGGSGSTERARIDSSGNVLIGDTSAAGTGLTLGNGKDLWFKATGYNTWKQVNYQGGLYWNNGSDRVVIDSSGTLLVGKTTSTNDVTTAGGFIAASGKTVLTTTGTDQPLVVARNNVTGALIEFYYGGSAKGSITTNGTTIAYNTSSDYRLKNTIAPMTGALAKVAALKPCTYKWNADGSDGEGFIAHELQEVCPSAVTGEKDAVDADGTPEYQGIDTSFLVATLTAAIQELKAIVDAQGAEIAALKGQP